MIEINTYIDGDSYDNEDIPYREFTGELAKEQDGTIEVIIDGHLFFNEKDEYIHLSWRGIIQSLLHFLGKNRKLIINTPSVTNPISLIYFEKVNNQLIKISHPVFDTKVSFDEENLPYHEVIEREKNIAIVEKSLLIDTLTKEGISFFSKLAELKPDRKKDFESEELNWLKKIRESLGFEAV